MKFRFSIKARLASVLAAAAIAGVIAVPPAQAQVAELPLGITTGLDPGTAGPFVFSVICPVLGSELEACTPPPPPPQELSAKRTTKKVTRKKK
jgi:hypothetical protein